MEHLKNIGQVIGWIVLLGVGLYIAGRLFSLGVINSIIQKLTKDKEEDNGTRE